MIRSLPQLLAFIFAGRCEAYSASEATLVYQKVYVLQTLIQHRPYLLQYIRSNYSEEFRWDFTNNISHLSTLIGIVFNFIVNRILENTVDFEKLFEFWKRFRPYSLKISSLIVIEDKKNLSTSTLFRPNEKRYDPKLDTRTHLEHI